MLGAGEPAKAKKASIIAAIFGSEYINRLPTIAQYILYCSIILYTVAIVFEAIWISYVQCIFYSKYSI